MGELFDRFDVPAVQGREITIGNHFPEVFVSERDEVICYLGTCPQTEAAHRTATYMPIRYMSGKHSFDEELSGEIQGFYRMIDGGIVLDSYIDTDHHSNYKYKRINAGIRFPMPDNYYAVFVNREEDDDLTREIFGLNHNEITSLLDAYAKIMGTYHEYGSFPKLTKSIKNNNFCDITELWIPERVPYVAFCTSGYDFSHVSLWGFYRHLQLLTDSKTTSLISRVLMANGASEETLTKVFSIERDFICKEKVTRAFLRDRY